MKLRNGTITWTDRRTQIALFHNASPEGRGGANNKPHRRLCFAQRCGLVIIINKESQSQACRTSAVLLSHHHLLHHAVAMTTAPATSSNSACFHVLDCPSHNGHYLMNSPVITCPSQRAVYLERWVTCHHSTHRQVVEAYSRIPDSRHPPA